jgi:PAS domain S-box-containing protein
MYGIIRPLVERCFQGETIEKEMAFDHEEESRVLLTRYYPILDESGRVSLVAGIIRDITNLRKAERELESFFNLSRDMMCVAGFDGTFKRINPAWESTLGWTEETFLKTPWIEFVHPDDIQPTLNAGEKLVDGKEIISFENRYRCRDGTYRWLSWNSRPVQKQGLIYAVVRDITSAKETEAALWERDRLQGTLETAGAVCHELNQPLQAITGYTDLLLLDIADRESSTEKARKIQEAVKLIGGITRKLAGITRYQTMDYIQGKIIDIDRASEKAPSKDPSSN